SRAGPNVRRGRKHGQTEHQMSGDHSGEGTSELREDVYWSLAPRETAHPCVSERDGGVQMSAGDWLEGEDERDECRAGRNRIRQKRDGHIATGETVGHDAGADDSREQEQGSAEFGDDSARKGGPH